MSAQTVSPHSLPYRRCAGIMLLSRDGSVFVGSRIDQTLEGWQMPQGGIDQDEAPSVAAMRELEEEIGTRNVEILREHPAWLNYDLPPHLVGLALRGRYRGQTQKWFAMRFLGQDGEINLATAHPEFSHWKWVPIEDVPRLVVAFKRDIYKEVIAAFGDLARPQA